MEAGGVRSIEKMTKTKEEHLRKAQCSSGIPHTVSVLLIAVIQIEAQAQMTDSGM